MPPAAASGLRTPMIAGLIEQHVGQRIASHIAGRAVAGAVGRGEGEAGIGRRPVGPVAEPQMGSAVGLDLGNEAVEAGCSPRAGPRLAVQVVPSSDRRRNLRHAAEVVGAARKVDAGAVSS